MHVAKLGKLPEITLIGDLLLSEEKGVNFANI